jgi:hypothetical protein
VTTPDYDQSSQEAIIATLDQIHSSLLRLEGLIDQLVTVVEDVHEDVSVTAWWAQSAWYRWRDAWRNKRANVDEKLTVLFAHYGDDKPPAN